ncbi:MAG: CAP domain-containing protein, partial [Gemmataceae bacterium]
MRRTARPRCEALEDRTVLSVTAQEQLFVYLLNRARHDPGAYQREQGLPVNLDAVTPRPPLAVSDALFASTGFHAADMATRNYFGHNTPEGLTPNQMVRNAGYPAASVFQANSNYVESIA